MRGAGEQQHRLLGIEIYTNYLYPLQIAAVLLLVAIIAAIALTLRERKDSAAHGPGQQVRVKKADRRAGQDGARSRASGCARRPPRRPGSHPQPRKEGHAMGGLTWATSCRSAASCSRCRWSASS
jgi:hypothetical protein